MAISKALRKIDPVEVIPIPNSTKKIRNKVFGCHNVL